jgi:hypothetical protein
LDTKREIGFALRAVLVGLAVALNAGSVGEGVVTGFTDAGTVTQTVVTFDSVDG